MRPASRQPYRNKTDHLSVTILPAPSVGTKIPYLRWPFCEVNWSGIASRLVDDSSVDSKQDGLDFTKAEAIIMSEVTDWLECHQYDDYWAPRTKKRRIVSYAYHTAPASL